MRIVEPYVYSKPSKKKSRANKWFAIVVFILVGLYVIWMFQRPIPLVYLDQVSLKASASSVALSWPSYGQAAIRVDEFGVAENHGATKPMPTASVAKVMLAIAVLQKHPIKVGATGPTITFSNHDVAIYKDYVAKNGSVVPVNAGEKMTQYQALQAILLPSANNVAYSLARWSFGSIDKYTAKANLLAKQFGMQNTHFADASGYSPKTVSTASDLAILGQKALNDPVLRQIISQKTATLPVVGVVRNYNVLLGHNNIIGIKTGNTDEAGGVYLFAAKQHYASGRDVTVVGAIMGAPNLRDAMRDSLPLMKSTFAGFGDIILAKPGQTIAKLDGRQGRIVSIITPSQVSSFGWRGKELALKPILQSLNLPLKKGDQVGEIPLSNGSVPVITKEAVPRPSFLWSLLNPFI